MQADIPDRVGDYTVEGLLEWGGSGRLLLGRVVSGEVVLIKTPKPDRVQDERVWAWFAEEVRILRRLGREQDTARYVPVLRDEGICDGVPFLVMDHIPGRTLLEESPLEADRLGAVATWLAEAVAACHRAKVVHNDIKPGNVVLATDGVRLVDFGLAVDPWSAVHPTRHEGTWGYMAPERYTRNGGNFASDVFSWGCAVAFAATGRPPFQGPGRQDYLMRTAEGDADLDGVEPGLRKVVERALRSFPDDRPSAPTLVEELRTGPPRPPLAEDSPMHVTRDVSDLVRATADALMPLIALGAGVAPEDAARRVGADLCVAGYQILHKLVPFLRRGEPNVVEVEVALRSALNEGELVEADLVRLVVTKTPDQSRLQNNVGTLNAKTVFLGNDNVFIAGDVVS